MFAPSLTPDTTRAVAASTLPLALSNAILMPTLRQQAMLTEQISRSLARSYRASHREAPLPNKQSRLACMAFSDSLALGHDWSMQNIEGQKEGIRLLAKACGEPTWLTPRSKKSSTKKPLRPVTSLLSWGVRRADWPIWGVKKRICPLGSPSTTAPRDGILRRPFFVRVTLPPLASPCPAKQG